MRSYEHLSGRRPVPHFCCQGVLSSPNCLFYTTAGEKMCYCNHTYFHRDIFPIGTFSSFRDDGLHHERSGMSQQSQGPGRYSRRHQSYMGSRRRPRFHKPNTFSSLDLSSKSKDEHESSDEKSNKEISMKKETQKSDACVETDSSPVEKLNLQLKEQLEDRYSSAASSNKLKELEKVMGHIIIQKFFTMPDSPRGGSGTTSVLPILKDACEKEVEYDRNFIAKEQGPSVSSLSSLETFGEFDDRSSELFMTMKKIILSIADHEGQRSEGTEEATEANVAQKAAGSSKDEELDGVEITEVESSITKSDGVYSEDTIRSMEENLSVINDSLGYPGSPIMLKAADLAFRNSRNSIDLKTLETIQEVVVEEVETDSNINEAFESPIAYSELQINEPGEEFMEENGCIVQTECNDDGILTEQESKENNLQKKSDATLQAESKGYETEVPEELIMKDQSVSPFELSMITRPDEILEDSESETSCLDHIPSEEEGDEVFESEQKFDKVIQEAHMQKNVFHHTLPCSNSPQKSTSTRHHNYISEHPLSPYKKSLPEQKYEKKRGASPSSSNESTSGNCWSSLSCSNSFETSTSTASSYGFELVSRKVTTTPRNKGLGRSTYLPDCTTSLNLLNLKFSVGKDFESEISLKVGSKGGAGSNKETKSSKTVNSLSVKSANLDSKYRDLTTLWSDVKNKMDDIIDHVTKKEGATTSHNKSNLSFCVSGEGAKLNDATKSYVTKKITSQQNRIKKTLEDLNSILQT